MGAAVREAAEIAINGRAHAFACYAKALMLTKGDRMQAREVFRSRWPHSIHLDMIMKSPVAPASTTDSTWAAPLAQMSNLGEAFIEVTRPLSVLGRISGFRPMPFNVRTSRQTMSSSVSWSAQGAASIVSQFGFEAFQFKMSKITGIIVATNELVRSSDPAADRLIRTELSEAVAQFSDQQFLDPSIAEVADISPASITFGAPEVTSTGTTLAAFTDDLSNLLGEITTSMNAIHLLMRRSTALWICKLKSGDGSDAFPNMGVNGGSIWGIPVIVSDNVPADTNSPTNTMIVAIDAAEVFLNEGGIEFDASEEAMIQMNSAPDSPATASTVMVSFWQMGLIGLLVRRFIRWQRRKDGAVAILTGVPH